MSNVGKDDDDGEANESGDVMAQNKSLMQDFQIEELQLRKISALMTRKERMLTVLLFVGIAITMGLLASYQFNAGYALGIFSLEIVFCIVLISSWVHEKRV